MINENGKKYLPIVWGKPVGDTDIWDESDWSLVYDNEEFAYTSWFSADDYEIYSPHQIKEQFFYKSTKLNVKKLEECGYEQVLGTTYFQAYKLFFELLQIKSLETYFYNISEDVKEEKMDEFRETAQIWDEWYIFENWLRLKLAKEWCEKRGIEYKLDIPNNFPKELSEEELRRRIKGKIRCTHFKPPFDFLNSYK